MKPRIIGSLFPISMYVSDECRTGRILNGIFSMIIKDIKDGKGVGEINCPSDVFFAVKCSV